MSATIRNGHARARRRVGDRVGIYTLLARIDCHRWEVRCECGRTGERSPSVARRRCGPDCPLPTLVTTHGCRPITRHVGHRFGRLVVIRIISRGNNAKAQARCDCGADVVACMGNIANGTTTSCGCAKREDMSARSRTHGAAHTPEHEAWKAMRTRCGNPNRKDFARYGGRGIAVCERWESFENFIADMGPKPSPKHEICRINNDGPYSPENCQWVTDPWVYAPKETRPETTLRGERVGGAKLTETQVREIRRRYAAGGVSQSTLASEYGIVQSAICSVIRGRRWAHVPTEAT